MYVVATVKTNAFNSNNQERNARYQILVMILDKCNLSIAMLIKQKAEFTEG